MRIFKIIGLVSIGIVGLLISEYLAKITGIKADELLSGISGIGLLVIFIMGALGRINNINKQPGMVESAIIWVILAMFAIPLSILAFKYFLIFTFIFISSLS